jgi:hypothetical protein
LVVDGVRGARRRAAHADERSVQSPEGIARRRDQSFRRLRVGIVGADADGPPGADEFGPAAATDVVLRPLTTAFAPSAIDPLPRDRRPNAGDRPEAAAGIQLLCCYAPLNCAVTVATRLP